MSIIGIELCDAGIMAADGTKAELLQIDGLADESPGFALPAKDGLLVGKAAESKAHLFPRQIIHHFWDQLSTEPLEQPGAHAPKSTAEIAYHHLEHIWRQIKRHGDEVLIVVPGFYGRQQLGLILGIANELSIPVRGFVPLAMAASPCAHPGKMILHLDIHLHRLEVTYLKQNRQLALADSVTGTEKGLLYLHRQWAEAIGQDFVASTRFDPFHQANSEQELYNRLPGILYNLRHSRSIAFDMTGGSRTYAITLTRKRIADKAGAAYAEICRIIEELRSQHEQSASPILLQLTHRLARLPGCRRVLADIENAEILELEKGAGARGAVDIWPELSGQSANSGISFFSSRPLPPAHGATNQARIPANPLALYPPYLLYRSLAYPITDRPLTVGCGLDSEPNDVTITGDIAGVSSRHFTVALVDGKIRLSDMSDQGTFVDEERIDGSIALKLGQTIRVGNPGEKLRVIACVDPDK